MTPLCPTASLLAHTQIQEHKSGDPERNPQTSYLSGSGSPGCFGHLSFEHPTPEGLCGPHSAHRDLFLQVFSKGSSEGDWKVFKFFAAMLQVLLAMGFPVHRWRGPDRCSCGGGGGRGWPQGQAARKSNSSCRKEKLDG